MPRSCLILLCGLQSASVRRCRLTWIVVADSLGARGFKQRKASKASGYTQDAQSCGQFCIVCILVPSFYLLVVLEGKSMPNIISRIVLL